MIAMRLLSMPPRSRGLGATSRRWKHRAGSRAIAVVALLLAPPLLSSTPTRAFELDDVLSSPFPSAMVASPSGDAVAWVFEERGRRNLWISSAPDWRGRAITGYAEDDGQELSDLAWSPDGSAIAFVRGGATNARGELPNPTSEPAGVETAIWLVPADGSAEPRRLAEGRSPLWLPDGTALLFSRNGEVWRTPIGENADGAAPEATPLIRGRGSFGSLRLSPDGARLALVSRRDRYSFVGVYDFATAELRFLDPGVDSDFSPVWSPGGDRLAFVRTPARQEITIFGAIREDQPWSIRVVDVDTDTSTGSGRELWRAAPGRGSVFSPVEGGSQLIWTRDDHLVFPWERDGWRHLYAIPLTGGEARLLTPGFFEVEYLAATADGTGAVYSSNQDDIDRRHLWQVAAAGGPPRALTSGSGVENIPVPLAGDHGVAFVGATGRRPLLPQRVDPAGRVHDLAPGALPARFPEQQLVEPEPVVFAAADGMRIHAQLFRPPVRFTGPRPGLLFLHGGSRRQMLLGWHYSSYYHDTYAFNQYMASRGWVVLSVNYRSGTGYGLEFREAEDYGATGASELADVLGAGLFMQNRDDVDPEAIALYGGSYGGYLTAMGLAHASDLFAAGVDIHGVHDWRRTIQNFVPSYDPKDDPEAARLAFESSPLAAIEGWRSPVLLIHGDDDRNVPFEETRVLVEELRERGVEHELLVLPDEVHGFLRHASWLELFGRSAQFLDRHLGVAASDERAVSAGGERR